MSITTMIPPHASPNVRLVTDFMRTIWTEASPDVLERFVSASFVDHAYIPADQTGHATMVRIFAGAFSQAEHTIEQCTEQDDTVVIRLKITALHSGQFRDIAATGNAVEVTQYRTFRIVEGQIAEHWALFDTASLLRQLQPTVIVAGACAIKQ